MSKTPNRRSPRTARAMPEARPRIERDKIKKRRPNDLLFEGDTPPPAPERRPAKAAGGGLYIDDGQEESAAVDWSDQGDLASEPSNWDEESEGDWVLDGDDDQAPEDDGEVVYGEDEPDEAEDGLYLDDGGHAGVVWEKDDYVEDEQVFEDPDEVAFGQPGSSNQNFGFAPEVELAGRRDVSPKAPKPPPAPRPRMPAQKPKRSARQQSQSQGRGQQVDWSPEGDLEGSITPQGEPGFARRQPEAGLPPARPKAQSHTDSRRFSQMRQPLEVAGDEQMLRQPRSDNAQRRRQMHPAAAAPMSSAAGRRHPVRRGIGGVLKLMVMALVLLLIAGGGWFAYQSIGADGIQPLIDRVTALLPLSNSTRTAADTSFGDQGTPEAISAEQALDRLENGALQADDALAATRASDQAEAGTDEPPVPQLKPLPGEPASVPAERSDVPADQAQLAASDGEAGEEPSIFEQLWRYLSPG